jgi:hypothetical protein
LLDKSRAAAHDHRQADVRQPHRLERRAKHGSAKAYRGEPMARAGTIGMIWQFVRRCYLEIALLACIAHLAWLVYAATSSDDPGDIPCLRNDGFPDTHIGRIHLDLTSPHHWVRLAWVGPQAADQNGGPFRSSPGAGGGDNDCNHAVESNCPNSLCTPKGTRTVEGFMDHLRDKPEYRYVTLIDARRAIGFHAHPSVPPYPASQGCVRLEPYAARLIHDNSIEGVTEIVVDGTWTNPRLAGSEEQGAGSQSSRGVKQ